MKDQPTQLGPAVSNATRLHPAGAAAGSVVGGILGGVGGLFAGAALGTAMAGDCNCDDPGLDGAIFGGLIGEAVGVALGAHLGDGRRGNFGLDLLTSTGGALLAMAMGSQSSDGSMVIPGAVLQLAGVAAVEVGNAWSKAKAP